MELDLKKYCPEMDVEDISNWSKAKWLDYRVTGIGCSELGTLAGHNKWETPSILFAKKVGLIPSGIDDNESMFMGRVLEPVVASIWQHYDPNDPVFDITSTNMADGVIVRELFKPEIYARNKKYPWLFGGPDGLFLHEGNLAVGEIKTISGYSADQYEMGIPSSYIFQIHGYMMLFDVDYAEIITLKDGRNFDVIPFERHQGIVDQIEEAGEDMWNRIQKAKKEYLSDGDWQQYEPEISGEAADEAYLKERFRSENQIDPIMVTDELQGLIEGYHSQRESEAVYTKEKKEIANKIKKIMGDAREVTDVVGFTCKWSAGPKRMFNIKRKKE